MPWSKTHAHLNLHKSKYFQQAPRKTRLKIGKIKKETMKKPSNEGEKKENTEEKQKEILLYFCKTSNQWVLQESYKNNEKVTNDMVCV